MLRDDYSYFRRRVVEEEAATRNAAGPLARERHGELAAAYRLRCGLIEKLIGKGAVRQIGAKPLARNSHEPPLYRFAGRNQQGSRARPESSGTHP